MSPTSRRILLYWLLLLVPTLVIGAAAIVLLRREQGRLVERGQYADEARHAAIAARARLIVENIELLVGDVQTGLLDALAAEPAGANLDSFLDRWEKTNPLVRIAFRSTPDGRVVRPHLRTASEDGRGFLRRFSEQFGSQPPWSETAPAKVVKDEKREMDTMREELVFRGSVSQNVAQAQSARRDVQELLKASNQAGGIATSDASARPAVAEAPANEARTGALADPASSRDAPQPGHAEEKRTRTAVPMRGEPAAPAGADQTVRAKKTGPDRRGWVPVTVHGRLHLIGWVQPGGEGDVRGVEVELAALISRMGSYLPLNAGPDEGFALRDGQGRVVHQTGRVTPQTRGRERGAEPTVRVPIAAALLPGWDVAAYWLPLAPAGAGAGLLWLSVLLVAIFVAAILAGGSLLVWQAKRSAEEAVQKTSFVANVSHEFKTPLTTIRLYSELLEQGRIRDAAQGNEYLRAIGRETQRLARLVNNALDFSRLEQGRKKYARESVDLGAEMTQLLDTHAPRVTDAGLTLERTLPATPLRVDTDRDAVEQIILNLIDNACKYAGASGVVEVAVEPGPGRGALISVRDRGPGVPPEHRERIFEKFHRVDDALTAERSGAGLGLSIARQLARGLGGDLRYQPRNGGGAEFVLELI